MPDFTLINLNMLFMRYGEEIERERHVPLGCLYLVSVLEQVGFEVDFRDYQLDDSSDPFDMERFLSFLADPAPVIGFSCMANLLPFTILAMKEVARRYPDRKLILGGVGTKCVEELILQRFPWISVICRGEGESTAIELLAALRKGQSLADVAGISYRDPSGGGAESAKSRLVGSGGDSGGRDARPTKSGGTSGGGGKSGGVHHNPDRPRIDDLDALPFPAFARIDLKRYAGYGMMTSRGCPYPCTFCSVAPVWDWQTRSRSPESIVAEMRFLHDTAGVDLFLFQDEFFVSGKRQVTDFCRALRDSGLKVQWKAFGRVNLTDEEMMRDMAACGCLELRFGIESGSDRILKLIKKGFTAQETLALIPQAARIFPRVDAFYVWGYPFETMEDFQQSLFQMISFRSMGARILPSLLSLLPQTEIYRDWKDKAKLEFCPYLLPEFVFTGHEVCRGSEVEIPAKHRAYFELIQANPDVFPGFFHLDLEGNVLPKLALLREFGFYPAAAPGVRRPEQTTRMAQPDPGAAATPAVAGG